jgi:hypothetical protein
VGSYSLKIEQFGHLTLIYSDFIFQLSVLIQVKALYLNNLAIPSFTLLSDKRLQ